MRSGNKQPLGISAHYGGLLTAVSVSPHFSKVVGTLNSRIHRSHNYLSQQVGVRSSKTSQCGSVNRLSHIQWYHMDHQGIWCPSKSLLFSLVAVSVCRHNLPPYTVQWSHSPGVAKGWLEASPWSLYFPH